MNWADLNQEQSYSAVFGYQQSKLANCLFTLELAKRLKDTDVIAVTLHPG
jgi:NAD(P)-dependent dehydrogenase (short-subunit alcohol dehydrogenase family)